MKRLTSSTLCDLMGLTSKREMLLFPLPGLFIVSGIAFYWLF